MSNLTERLAGQIARLEQLKYSYSYILNGVRFDFENDLEK